MQRVRRDQFTYEFRPETIPILEIDPGESFVVETYDASTGRLQTADALAAYLAIRDPLKVNPAGGPIAVRGARSGDELVVTIEEIRFEDRGYVRTAPGGPVLPDLDPPRAFMIPIRDGFFEVNAGLRMPVRPMVGVIGTSPASGVVYTRDPGAQGSNLDCNAISKGARVHLPVHVAGALLAIGDVHASMGDGEISGTGIEINGEVQASVEVLDCGSHGFPWVETATEIVSTGHAPTVTGAITQAVDRMTRLLAERHSLGRTEAFMAISAGGDVRIGQCCGGLDATAYVAFPRIA